MYDLEFYPQPHEWYAATIDYVEPKKGHWYTGTIDGSFVAVFLHHKVARRVVSVGDQFAVRLVPPTGKHYVVIDAMPLTEYMERLTKS